MFFEKRINESLKVICGSSSIFVNLKIIYLTLVTSGVAIFFINLHLLPTQDLSTITQGYYNQLSAYSICITGLIFLSTKKMKNRTRRVLLILYSYLMLIYVIKHPILIETLYHYFGK